MFMVPLLTLCSCYFKCSLFQYYFGNLDTSNVHVFTIICYFKCSWFLQYFCDLVISKCSWFLYYFCELVTLNVHGSFTTCVILLLQMFMVPLLPLCSCYFKCSWFLYYRCKLVILNVHGSLSLQVQ